MGISFLAGYFLRNVPKREIVYELKEPLRIETNNELDNYYLPVGTLLYLDWEPPEGSFDRYRVYINIFGAPLDVTRTEKKGLISPLTAFNKKNNLITKNK